MINLAGTDSNVSNLMLKAELGKAALTALQIEPTREREVPATIIGYYNNGKGQELFLTRAWTYWCASLRQPMPYEMATAFHEKWGNVVRVDGYAGGMKPGKSGVYSYHIDTQDGLNAFVAEVTAQAGTHSSDGPTPWLES